jgi:cation:H+ antiporter
VISLLIAVGASAAFTRRLEVVSDLWRFSPGLLSLLGALGANIPNYVASLSAAVSGQAGVGIGIIIGSNIYNIAVILGIAAFASPTHHGLILSRQEAQDARLVGGTTLAMMVTTGLAAGFFSWKVSPDTSHQATVPAGMALLALNLLTLGLFCLLSLHAFRRTPEPHLLAKRAARHLDRATKARSRSRWSIVRILCEMTLALGIALGGVIVMVQVGQAAAVDVHLPPALLSLIVLAIATSLPNTIVAFTLARTGRASASVEEVFSSNSVNAALGIALPLLFWSGTQSDRFLVMLDGPLMITLTFVALLCVLKQRVSRTVGWLLILVYIGWIVIHVLL